MIAYPVKSSGTRFHIHSRATASIALPQVSHLHGDRPSIRAFIFWWWRPNAKVGRVYRGIVDLPLVDGGDSRSAQERAWAYWQTPGSIGVFSLAKKKNFLGWKKAFFLNNFLQVYFLFLPVPLNQHDFLPRQVISYTYSYPFTRNGVHSASSGLHLHGDRPSI